MKVLIIDNFPVMCLGLVSLISEYWPGAKFECVDNGNDIINKYDDSYDLVIYDPENEAKPYAEIISRMLVRNRKSNILVYTDLAESIFAVPMFKLGVKGFISKTAPEPELLTALTIIVSGSRYASKGVLDIIMNQIIDSGYSKKQQLSGREIEVATLLSGGSKVIDIATLMGLNIGTVSTYKVRIFKKLNIKSVVELAGIINSSY